ncbi:odorant receptor 49a-like [Diprion similis]|uniref:odorant receptor 49a-like n=1 Tax=Diprion similis TaxID=362088 RepID=UPI001EF8E59B|nr:odorant receptor 49a-like [Diprion similis]
MSNSRTVEMIEGSDKFNEQFVTAIRTLRRIAIYMGIWPEKKHEKLCNLLWYYNSTNLVFMNFGLMCNAIRVRDDMNKVISTISVASGVMYIMVKWFTFSSHKVLIRKLVYMMNEDWTSLENNTLIPESVPDSKRLMLKYYRVLNIYVYTVLTVMVCGNANFVITFVVATNHRDNNTDLDNLLPVIHSWYPGVDYDRAYIIGFLAAAQIMSMIAVIVGNTVVDGFFVITVLNTTAQIEILGIFIEQMKYNSLDPECNKTNIQEVVKRHQVLLSVANNIQECFGAIAFQRVSISLVGICFSAHVFLRELQNVGEGNAAALKYGFTFLAALGNVFAYCSVSDTLATESLAIGTHVYNSEWYNATSSAKLSLSILMIKASRPMIITAAKIFPLTMENFTVIIKSIASYISALRAFSVSHV